MVTNELKRGTRIQQTNGWYGTIMDNAKGNIRMVDVEGLYRETGSVYSHDIARARIEGKWVELEHTPAQKKLQKTVSNFFGEGL